MKIGGVYSSKIARARLISQARMKSAGRAKKFSGSRINTGLSSGSYMDQLRKGLTSKTGNTGAALSNLQKKSNYTSLISSAESLKKHADKLLDTKEEESLFTEEKKQQAVKEIKGFVEDYNRMVERLQRVGTTVSSLYLKQLQGHVADNKDLLRELGITQNTTGTLKINEDKLKEADPEKLKKLFGTDGGFGDKISSWAEKIQANAEANLAGYYGNENLYGNNYNRYGTNISGYGGGFNTRG